MQGKAATPPGLAPTTVRDRCPELVRRLASCVVIHRAPRPWLPRATSRAQTHLFTTASSERHPMDFDVAIVGLGPTGMTLAALLAQQGRSVVVLERYPGLYNLPRAAAFDDETMRTFQKLGVAEKMLPGTNVQSGYVWVNGQDEVLLDIEYDNPGRCGWPSQYMMYQPHVETVLHELVGTLTTVEVRRGTQMIGIDQHPHYVAVTSRDAQGIERQIHARYVVGCDGGNSSVRHAIGVGIDDYGFFENWLVCDFRLRHDVPGLPSFRQVCNPEEPIAIVNIGPG